MSERCTTPDYSILGNETVEWVLRSHMTGAQFISSASLDFFKIFITVTVCGEVCAKWVRTAQLLRKFALVILVFLYIFAAASSSRRIYAFRFVMQFAIKHASACASSFAVMSCDVTSSQWRATTRLDHAGGNRGYVLPRDTI